MSFSHVQVCAYTLSLLLETLELSQLPGHEASQFLSILLTAVFQVPRTVPGTQLVLHECLWKEMNKQLCFLPSPG